MMNLLMLGALALSDAEAKDVVLVDSGPAEMEDKRGYSTLVTPGVMAWPPGVKVRVQQQITDHASVMLGAGLAGGRIEGCDCDGLEWVRWQAIAGADYHPLGNGMHGPYVGPRVLYRHGGTSASLWESEATAEQDLLVVRGIVGYRWIFDPGLSVAAGIGGGVRQSLRTYGVDGEEAGAISSASIVPSLELNLSWAF